MSNTDYSSEAAALAQRSLGSEHLDFQPQPAYLRDRSTLMLTEVQGDDAYLKRLDDAAKELYHQIKGDASVSSYIENGRSVLGQGRQRGVLTPFCPKREPDYRKALRWVLHSVAFIASTPTYLEKKLAPDPPGEKIAVIRDRQYLSVPMTTSAYGTGQGKYPLKRDCLAQIVYALSVFFPEKDAWVKLYAGRHDDDSGKGLVTRLEPLTPLRDFLVHHRLVFVGHPKRGVKGRADKDVSLIVVNVAAEGSGGSDLRPLYRDLTESEVILPLLNNKLAKQQLTLHLPNYAAYRRHWKDGPATSRLRMHGSKQLRRQFRFRDGIAGRVYGHFVQQLPGDVRPYLKIDKQTVVEADYNAMQLAILYAERGIPLPQGDLYEITGGNREAMKTVLTRSVGNATKAETVNSLANSSPYCGRDQAKATRQYEQFWSVHQAVCPHDAEGMGPWPWLQNIDSEIALRVLRLLYDQGAYAIPVHDSFIVKARFRGILVDAMQQAWSERYPDTEIGVKITDAGS